jgi:hypothetical protein
MSWNPFTWSSRVWKIIGVAAAVALTVATAGADIPLLAGAEAAGEAMELGVGSLRTATTTVKLGRAAKLGRKIKSAARGIRRLASSRMARKAYHVARDAVGWLDLVESGREAMDSCGDQDYAGTDDTDNSDAFSCAAAVADVVGSTLAWSIADPRDDGDRPNSPRPGLARIS